MSEITPNLKALRIDHLQQSVNFSCVSGSMLVYDSVGEAHSLENLLTDKADGEPFTVWSLNEKTRRMEKTSVKMVIRQRTKQPMIRIKTSHATLETTGTHKVMVNRNGDLTWSPASEICKGDLVMAPKTFFRAVKNCNWKDAITIKYESFPGEGNRPHGLAAKFQGSWQSLHLPSGFNLNILYYLVGMLDASGQINEEQGVIRFTAFDWPSMFSFASSMGDLFMLEPVISGDFDNGYAAEILNKIGADILGYALRNLFQQEDSIVSSYLSGFLDASGYIETSDNGPLIQFFVKDAVKKHRLKKAMHVFGVLAPKETRDLVIVEAFSDVENLGAAMDSRLDFNNSAFCDIARSGFGPDKKNVGFRLGEKLIQEREKLNIAKRDFGFSSAKITRYEKDGIVPLADAWAIAEKLQSKINPNGNLHATKTEITELISSDLIGVKVLSIEDIGEQWPYDIYCIDNHNFFANDILCRDCSEEVKS